MNAVPSQYIPTPDELKRLHDSCKRCGNLMKNLGDDLFSLSDRYELRVERNDELVAYETDEEITYVIGKLNKTDDDLIEAARQAKQEIESCNGDVLGFVDRARLNFNSAVVVHFHNEAYSSFHELTVFESWRFGGLPDAWGWGEYSLSKVLIAGQTHFREIDRDLLRGLYAELANESAMTMNFLQQLSESGEKPGSYKKPSKKTLQKERQKGDGFTSKWLCELANRINRVDAPKLKTINNKITATDREKGYSASLARLREAFPKIDWPETYQDAQDQVSNRE